MVGNKTKTNMTKAAIGALALVAMSQTGASAAGSARSPECSYAIQPGDTLNELARARFMTVDMIVANNPIIFDKDLIHVGDVLDVCAWPREFTGNPSLAIDDTARIQQDQQFADHPDITAFPDVHRFAESIARIESRGNYRAEGPWTRWGTAKGKYQFIDDTWQRAAGLVPNANQYRTALHAPDHVQDEVAIAWFQSLLHRYDGNYTAVAVAHHAGEGTADRFMKSGYVGTADVLGTRSMDYAANAVGGMQ